MSNLNRRRAARALVVAAAALALPAAADAASWDNYEYAADARGEVSISLVQDSNNGEVVERTRLRFDYDAVFGPDIRFTEDRELFAGAAVGRITLSNVDATISWVHADPDIEDVDCSGRSATAQLGGLYPLGPFQPQAPANSMLLVPFFEVKVDISCSKPGWRRLEFAVTNRLRVEAAHLQPIFSIDRVDVGSNVIPRAAIRRRSTIDDCPLSSGRSDIVSCETSFGGAVRLESTYHPNDLLAPLVPTKPKVTKQAKQVEAKVECRGGCEAEIGIFMRPRRGRGQIYYPGRKGRGRTRSRAVASLAAATRPVASWKVQVRAARGAQRLSLAIPAAARRALLRAGRAHVAIQLSPPRGRAVRRDFAVTVPR